MDQNCLLLNRWWRLLISGVVYKSAGFNYWSVMSSTNPQCSLQIRGVIYQSAIRKYVFACSSRYNDLTFYEKKISHFTIPLSERVELEGRVVSGFDLIPYVFKDLVNA